MFTNDILLQTPDIEAAAQYYEQHLGLSVTDRQPDMISLHGPQLNVFLHREAPLGPVLEVLVDDVPGTRARLLADGATLLLDDPSVPRLYLRDRYGLIYNLAARSAP